MARDNRILIIFINPLSSVARKGQLDFIKNFFRDRFNFDLKIFYSEYSGHMPQLVAEELKNFSMSNKNLTVIAIGGDGTLKEVCTGVVMSELENIKIGYIPSGTANIMAKELGIRKSLENACSIIGRSEKIVKLKMGFADKEYFLFTCGVGVDGAIVKNVNLQLKKFIGGGAYVISGIKTIISIRKNKSFSIIIDGKEFYARSIIVNRAKRYAANIKIFKNADLTADKIEVLIFKKINFTTLLKIIIKSLFEHVTFSDENFIFVTGKEIILKQFNQIPTQIDGDYISYTPKKIGISSSEVSIIVP